MPRARRSIVWTPTWNDDIQQWTKAFLHRNHWRVDPIHTVDDLMQDAYLLFVKLKDRYPRVTTHAAFMKLYKASLRNALHDHARGMMLKRMAMDDCPVDETYVEALIGDVTNEGRLLLTLRDLPPSFVAALRLLATNPEALEPEVLKRENLNQKLRRVLGFGKGFEFTRSLRTLLQE